MVLKGRCDGINNIGLKIASFFTILISFFVWIYLMYRVLNIISADELTWFLFWMYLPLGFLVNGLSKLIDWSSKE